MVTAHDCLNKQAANQLFLQINKVTKNFRYFVGNFNKSQLFHLRLLDMRWL